MATKIRINLANPMELLELPGLDTRHVDAILQFRAEHGPIKDAHQLAAILGTTPLADAVREQADFSPADATAPEAPGA